jgi:meso-butanediol dehydrogenase/(S,S)-butanediol dehydrogenase/diacetyl reductase
MAGRLEGKVALITGTSSGQGRSAALLFAKEGARVVGCGRNVENAKETVEMVKAAGVEMVSMQPVDLSDEKQVKRWIDFAVKTYGRIDILLNNAASVKFAPFEQLTTEDWHFTMRNELDIIYYACHYAWPYLKASGNGVIINTASVAGMMGVPGDISGNFAHATGKGGVIAVTRQLAIEGAPFGIRANVISPGLILTPATEGLLEQPKYMNAWLEWTPLHRLGKPEEVAAVALFLASDESSYVTGVNIAVDGGLTAK